MGKDKREYKKREITIAKFSRLNSLRASLVFLKLNHYFKSHLNNNRFLYIFTLQQILYIVLILESQPSS